MFSLAVVIPAAGAGSRMGAAEPKPFLSIEGRTILEWTVRPFLVLPELNQLVVAAGPEYHERLRGILAPLMGPVTLSIVAGGAERQDSVHLGVSAVDQATDLIAVHDAVRPFVRSAQIRSCCEEALVSGGAVLGVPARDTIKVCDPGRFVQQTPDRRRLWQCQTPQVFPSSVLRRALEQARKTGFRGTDDASVVEHMGGTVRMVEGDVRNIKITYPLDLKIAEMILKQEAE